MIAPLSSLALAATLLMPIADTVPHFDVEPGCRSVGQMGESLNARLPRCLDDEKSARSQLEREWTQYARNLRQECTGAATAGGSPSYVELLECLMMQRDAEKMERADRNATKMQNAARPEH